MILFDEQVVTPFIKDEPSISWFLEEIRVVIDCDFKSDPKAFKDIAFKLDNVMSEAMIVDDETISISGYLDMDLEIDSQNDINEIVGLYSSRIKNRMSEISHKYLYDVTYVFAQAGSNSDDVMDSMWVNPKDQISMSLYEENIFYNGAVDSYSKWKFDSIIINILPNQKFGWECTHEVLFKLGNVFDDVLFVNGNSFLLEGIDTCVFESTSSIEMEKVVNVITEKIKGRLSEVMHDVAYKIQYNIGLIAETQM